MALKDEPSPKYTFPGAGTSLLKSYKKKHKRCARTSEKEATNEVATEKEIDQALQVPLATPQQELYVYTCPFCQGSVTTSTASGHINHRRVCGKQFRVQDGLLRPTLPTIRYSHTCPTCGTCVQSTKKFGRIQSKHKQPSGRMCRLTQWHASWQQTTSCSTFLSAKVHLLYSFIFFYILLLTTAVLLVAIAARPHVNPGPHQQKGYNVSSRTLE